MYVYIYVYIYKALKKKGKKRKEPSARLLRYNIINMTYNNIR